jgi:hypothetical protein
MSLPNPTKPPSGTQLTRPPRGYLEKRAPAPLRSRLASHRQQLPFPQRLDAPAACIRDRSPELKSSILHMRYRPQNSREYTPHYWLRRIDQEFFREPHGCFLSPDLELFSSTGPSIRPILISGLPLPRLIKGLRFTKSRGFVHGAAFTLICKKLR